LGRVFLMDASQPPDINWFNIELFIHCKPHSSDPFKDPAPHVDRTDHNFVRNNRAANESRDQMILYASAQLTMQLRQFCFSISIAKGNEARLMRWDRGGVIVSECFDFVKNPALLLEFFWRFSHLELEQRGIDTSASSPTAEEVAMAVEGKIFGEGDRLHKIGIKNEADGNGACGSSTRGYIAMDVETGERVWVKDAWRVDTPETGAPKEFVIYEKLHNSQVSNIPQFRSGGDVGEQKTRTHEYQDEPWCCGERDASDRIVPYRHYRLALQVIIGRPLEEYRSTKELCVVILDALIALGEAYLRAGILQCDVSADNVLIAEGGRGVLVDWDQCQEMSARNITGQDVRIGSWRFMSINTLQNEPVETIHEHHDDLESIFWLLLFHVLRYQPNVAKKVEDLEYSLKKIFDYGWKGRDGQNYGGEGKVQYLNGNSIGPEDLESALPAPLAGLLSDLWKIFSMVHTRSPYVSEDAKKEDRDSLLSIDAMRNIFQARLAEGHWPEDDAAVDPCRPTQADGTEDRCRKE
ncbi:hypothetical protein EVG20_g1689, partial [Dentipellis fragilis]